MLWLIAGLILFFLSHGIRIYAGGLRERLIEQLGPAGWRGIYSAVSLVSLVLLIYGYSVARYETSILYDPPTWTAHIAATLMLLSMILMVASGGPAGRIKAALRHPMVLSVKVWALAHLLANGTVADVVLFGSLLVWAVLDFRVLRKEDRANGTEYVAVSKQADIIAVVAGTAVWAAIAFFLHEWLIGVAPFG